MFREIILPIFRSTKLCVTACGIIHPRCCRPPAGNIVCPLYSVFSKVGLKVTLVQSLRLCTGRTAHWRTTALEGGEGSASRPGRSLPPGKTRDPLYRNLGGPQGRSGQLREISPPPVFDPRTFQPVASRYTDWATRPTCIWYLFLI